MSLSVLLLLLVRAWESLVFWWYGPFSFMMLVMVPLVLRSSILGVHELGGCAVTGGHAIKFWYICDAWMHLVVVVYWLLKESASAGSSDGSVSLGPGSVAIWNEYGGSGRQYPWLVLLSCVYGLAACWRCWSWKTCSLGFCSVVSDIEKKVKHCHKEHYHTLDHMEQRPTMTGTSAVHWGGNVVSYVSPPAAGGATLLVEWLLAVLVWLSDECVLIV